MFFPPTSGNLRISPEAYPVPLLEKARILYLVLTALPKPAPPGYASNLTTASAPLPDPPDKETVS